MPLSRVTYKCSSCSAFCTLCNKYLCYKSIHDTLIVSVVVAHSTKYTTATIRHTVTFLLRNSEHIMRGCYFDGSACRVLSGSLTAPVRPANRAVALQAVASDPRQQPPSEEIDVDIAWEDITAVPRKAGVKDGASNFTLFHAVCSVCLLK